MSSINHQRSETRRQANEYPYSDKGRALALQTAGNVKRRREDKRESQQLDY
jgi:hypothetical protein